MSYLLPMILFGVSFGDFDCNSIVYTDGSGTIIGVPTGIIMIITYYIYMFCLHNIYIIYI